MPLITDNIQQADEQFRRTFLTESVQPIVMTQTNTYNARGYYLVTPSDFCEIAPFRNDYVLLSYSETLSSVDEQFSFISLSQAMFKNAKPLEGQDLTMLNEAYSKYFSKTPTRL